LGTHIHCSKVTDLDVYTVEGDSALFRCKKAYVREEFNKWTETNRRVGIS